MAELRLGHAVALGALQGPAELLPISSSGHVAIVPWLLGWEYTELEPGVRKTFEVLLHGATAAALLITLRGEVRDAIHDLSPRLITLVTLSFLPPAAVGYLLEQPIERHLGGPGSVAAGLIAGSVVMIWGDRAPQLRRREDAGAADSLWLGLAQAAALIPGVSRNGATLAVARRRQFTRQDANVLSRHVALPIIAGATILKLTRLRRRQVPPGSGWALAAGAATSFLSTLSSTWVIRQVERDRSLMPYAVYRCALAGAVLRRRGQRSAG